MTADMRSVTVVTLHGQISMQHRLQLKHEYIQCHVAIFMAQKHNPILYRIIHALGVATVCIRIQNWSRMGLTELPKLMIAILIPL